MLPVVSPIGVRSQGGFRGFAMCFAFWLLVCSFWCFPSLRPLTGYWVSTCSTHCVQCWIDRCPEVGCGWVAMVTFLLLRRLMPPLLLPLWYFPSNTSIGLEFKREKLAIIDQLWRGPQAVSKWFRQSRQDSIFPMKCDLVENINYFHLSCRKAQPNQTRITFKI